MNWGNSWWKFCFIQQRPVLAYEGSASLIYTAAAIFFFDFCLNRLLLPDPRLPCNRTGAPPIGRQETASDIYLGGTALSCGSISSVLQRTGRGTNIMAGYDCLFKRREGAAFYK